MTVTGAGKREKRCAIVSLVREARVRVQFAHLLTEI